MKTNNRSTCMNLEYENNACGFPDMHSLYSRCVFIYMFIYNCPTSYFIWCKTNLTMGKSGITG